MTTLDGRPLSEPTRYNSAMITAVTIRYSSLLLSLLAALGGCASTVGPGSDASVDVRSSAVRCNAAPPEFPTFDRACVRRDDCAIAVHQTDCCGNTLAIGLRTTEVARFTEAERQCTAQYPGCGCPSTGTRAEDGNVTLQNASIVVDCVANRCATSIPAAPVQCGMMSCAAGQLCAPGCCGAPGCVPPPGRCVAIPAACNGRPTCACLGAGACPSGSCVSVEGSNVVCVCA